MQVLVNEKPKSFHLAMMTDGKPNWRMVVGHEIKVDEYTFCGVGLPKGNGDFEINISEATTGLHVTTIANNPVVHEMTSTKEGTMAFYEIFAGEYLKKIVSNPKFPSVLEKKRIELEQLYGEMPESQEFDDNMITEPISKNLN